MPAVITIDGQFPLADDEAGSLIYELAIVGQTHTDAAIQLSANELVGSLSRAAAGFADGPSAKDASALRALERALANTAFDGQLASGLAALRHGVTSALH